MERLTRKLSEETKSKISKSLKGKKKNDEHRKRISEGMKEYWKKIPLE